MSEKNSPDRWLKCWDSAREIVARYRAEAPRGFDPSNSGIAIAVGVGAAATAYGAYSASQSQKEANATNQELAAANNALNYRMFLEGRGSQGNALLPLYMPSGTEARLGSDTLAGYMAMLSAAGTPAGELAKYQAASDAMLPAQSGAEAAVSNLFSGKLSEQEVANIAPVQAARASVAKAQKTGILEGLQARLNALSADRARAGYQGGGSALQKNILTSATIPALQQAATVGAQADLANASDVANIKNAALQQQIQNINLPGQSALNRMQLTQAPQSAAAAAQANRLNLFNWFKLNPASFQATPGPWVTPVANTGQIVGAGLSAGASGIGNYLALKSLANQSSTPSLTVGDYIQRQNMLNESSGMTPGYVGDINTTYIPAA